MPVVPFIPLIAATLPMVTQGLTSKQEAIPTPSIPSPTAMPTINGANDSAARRKSLAEQISRKSRASSILSDAEAKAADPSSAFG